MPFENQPEKSEGKLLFSKQPQNFNGDIGPINKTILNAFYSVDYQHVWALLKHLIFIKFRCTVPHKVFFTTFLFWFILGYEN